MDAVQYAALWPIWIYVILGILGFSSVTAIIMYPKDWKPWILFLVVTGLLSYQISIASSAGISLKRIYITAGCILGLGILGGNETRKDELKQKEHTQENTSPAETPEPLVTSPTLYDSMIFDLIRTTPEIGQELYKIFLLDKKLSRMAAKGENPLMGMFATDIEEIERRQDDIAQKIASIQPVEDVEDLALYISVNINRWGDQLVHAKDLVNVPNPRGPGV